MCVPVIIHKNIYEISSDNFNTVLNKIKSDIYRWRNLKTSLQGRINTIKINVLPRLNFLFFMLPVCPPPSYFKDIHSMVSNFIWDEKQPRVRLTIRQRPKLLGGLAVPNFELYWSFQIRQLSPWVDTGSTTAWKRIEANKVMPYRLQSILFSSINTKIVKK